MRSGDGASSTRNAHIARRHDLEHVGHGRPDALLCVPWRILETYFTLYLIFSESRSECHTVSQPEYLNDWQQASDHLKHGILAGDIEVTLPKRQGRLLAVHHSSSRHLANVSTGYRIARRVTRRRCNSLTLGHPPPRLLRDVAVIIHWNLGRSK